MAKKIVFRDEEGYIARWTTVEGIRFGIRELVSEPEEGQDDEYGKYLQMKQDLLELAGIKVEGEGEEVPEGTFNPDEVISLLLTSDLRLTVETKQKALTLAWATVNYVILCGLVKWEGTDRDITPKNIAALPNVIRRKLSQEILTDTEITQEQKGLFPGTPRP